MKFFNHTSAMYFTLVGISDVPELQYIIFCLALLIYLTTLGGNMTIFILVCMDCHLHTPMYFFLCNLSLMDMSSSTTTVHRVLVNVLLGDNRISFVACMIQMLVFASLTCDELMLLMAMSYDRYAAICSPLYYHVLMSWKACRLMAVGCWVIGFVQVLPLVVLFFGFTCFKSLVVNHFFCDTLPLLQLPCDNVFILELLIFVNGVFLAIFPFLLTFLPYIVIIRTILKIPSTTGRHKAFYTCSSHLTVVVLLYTSLVFQYLRPSSSINDNKFFSLFNTVAIPMLNPLIYSLKNKDVKAAMKRKWRVHF